MKNSNSIDYWIRVIWEFCGLTKETEWVEFKHNDAEPKEIGQYISALANSAALLGKPSAYVIWGVKDGSHDLLGTSFTPSKRKVDGEELENWLLRQTDPKIDFKFHELSVDEKSVILLEIDAAYRCPVSFQGIEYIRIGSYKKKLKDHPEKERSLWRVFDRIPFERQIAESHVGSDKVLALLNYPAYFDLLGLPLPPSSSAILEALESDELIQKNNASTFDITNLGGLLFAKDLSNFRSLRRKAVRIVLYTGEGRIETTREYESTKGYASGFEDLIDHIFTWIPKNEVMGKALRKDIPMFPESAIREIIPNALIHQDFQQIGTGVMIELFSNRLEVTNPGIPLVKPDRFLDSPPKSRNELMASFLRRIGICEERGSGVDKIVASMEAFQLPAPLYEVTDEHTRAVLFAHKELRNMEKEDRLRACYLHASLKFVQRNYMTNTSLRERFGIDQKNSATISRMIREALDAGVIKAYDLDASKKYMKYVPYWAKY